MKALEIKQFCKFLGSFCNFSLTSENLKALGIKKTL